MELISCIRFSLQLLAAEGAMVWGLPGRKNFGLRLAAGLAGYFAFALLIFFGLRSLPETKLAGEIAYYILLFGATLGLVWFCWEISGKELQNRCDEVYITLNKNTVPNDPRSPFVTSGVRIGTPAVTTRGLVEKDMDKIAECIWLAATDFENKADYIRDEVTKLCDQYPLYQ